MLDVVPVDRRDSFALDFSRGVRRIGSGKRAYSILEFKKDQSYTGAEIADMVRRTFNELEL